MAIVNNIIVDGWTVLDFSSDPVTGLTAPGDVTLTLQRQSGSTMVAASESVSFTEVGSTGRYYFSFTPENQGLYILYGREINVGTMQRTFEFRYDVLAAGAAFAATYDNAYCAETDIERWVQQAISATTEPSDTEAAAFAESRASVLTSLVTGWGYAVTPSTVVADSVLEDLLREANAVGASMDYTIAQQFGRARSVSDKGPALESLWLQYIGDGKTPGYLEVHVRGNLASLATNHTLSGDTTPRTETTAPIEDPIGIGMGEKF